MSEKCDFLLLAQTVLYFYTTILGFLVAIPVAVTTNKFNGGCILYGEIKWLDTRNFQSSFGKTPVCHFVTYLHIFTSIVYSFICGLMHSVALHRKRHKRPSGLRRWSVGFMAWNIIVLAMTLTSCCLLTVGFNKWCSDLLGGKEKHVPISYCSEGEGFTWGGVDGSSFYRCLVTAQAASWIILIVWLIQIVLTVVKAFREKPSHSDSVEQLHDTLKEVAPELEAGTSTVTPADPSTVMTNPSTVEAETVRF